MPIYTVSQISDAIKKTLEGSFSSLQIRGEISNLRLQSSGHYYFTLKDENSQLSCALFRGDAMRLKTKIKDGDQIVASGSLSVFAPKGTYQLIVKEITHQGLGELLAKLEALKQKFKQMGYFDPTLKKALPKFPKTIGVVTSPTGAVIQDIIQTLSRRHKGFKLLLVPTKVQGEGASDEISMAIDFLNKKRLCDVMIVGRGGGSLEDLFCFNDEKVVEAIYKSEIPVISAVGHETDFTLCDFVADIRAPTPTAAAEMVLFDLHEFMKQIYAKEDAISKLFSRKLSQEKKLLEQIKKRPELSSPSILLQGFYYSIDKLESRLSQILNLFIEKQKVQLHSKKMKLVSISPENQLKEKKAKLQEIKSSLSFSLSKIKDASSYKLKKTQDSLSVKFEAALKEKKQKLDLTAKLLYSINPENVLNKGYAILQSVDESQVFTSIFDLDETRDTRLKMKDGSCVVKIKQKSLI
jgi:exodeoxyribonuclease VII large subunit